MIIDEITHLIDGAWLWLKARWPVVVVAVSSILAFVVGGLFVRELRRPDKRIRSELEVVRYGEKAARLAVERGTEQAVRILEEHHVAEIQALDDFQKAKYERARQDPRALAVLLSRLSDKS